MLTQLISYAIVTVFMVGGLWYLVMRVFFGEGSRQAQRVKEKGRQFVFFLAVVATGYYFLMASLAQGGGQ